MTTRLEKKKKGLFRSGTKENPDTDILGSERVAQPTVYREHSKVSVFFILMAGIAAGAVAFWLLAVPANRCRIRVASDNTTGIIETRFFNREDEELI